MDVTGIFSKKLYFFNLPEPKSLVEPLEPGQPIWKETFSSVGKKVSLRDNILGLYFCYNMDQMTWCLFPGTFRFPIKKKEKAIYALRPKL
jgi:hypothetical protein